MAKAKQTAPAQAGVPLVEKALSDTLPIKEKEAVKKDAPMSSLVIRTKKPAAAAPTTSDHSLSKSTKSWVLGEISTKQHQANVKKARQSRSY